MNKRVFNAIIDHIFGRKYYANVVNNRGTEICWMVSHIFHTKAEAQAHRRELVTNRSLEWVETISFRSHKEY